MKLRSKYIWWSIATAIAIIIVVTVVFFPKHHSVSENSILTKKEQERPVSNDQPSGKSVSKSEIPDLIEGNSKDVSYQKSADLFNNLSDKASSLLKSPINGVTFQMALDILKNKNETLESRLLALQWLNSVAKKLGPDERRLLHEIARAIAVDSNDELLLRARAMKSVVAMSALMRDLDEMSQRSIIEDNDFIVQMAEDILLDASIRASAIEGIEVLQITEGISLLEEILADPEEHRILDLVRRASLALTRLAPDKALPLVTQIINETEDASVFGTAAYSLGQINSPKAVATLVQNADRFPDAGSCDFALVDMEVIILAILRDQKSEEEDVIAAIRATQYLWREGQSEDFEPLLKELIDNPSLEIKKATVERLMQEALEKPRTERQNLLRDLLEGTKKYPELSELSSSIEKRLTAKTMESRISTIPVPLTKEE